MTKVQEPKVSLDWLRSFLVFDNPLFKLTIYNRDGRTRLKIKKLTWTTVCDFLQEYNIDPSISDLVQIEVISENSSIELTNVSHEIIT